MVDPEPRWIYKGGKSITKWYGHVRVWEDCVLGQWFCFDLDSGAVRWERNNFRPNTIIDVADGVIVATEMRSDGPWTVPYGCYGISVQTGELLWVSHANGLYGKFLRLLDKVPGFTNELRDDPLALVEGQVLTRRGRLLELASGRCMGTDKKLALGQSKKSLIDDDDHQFYYGKMIKLERGKGGAITTCPPGKTLLPYQIPAALHGPYDIGFYRYAEDGQLQWSKTIRDLGGYSHQNFYSYRLRDPYIYCVVSEDKIVVPRDPKKPYLVERCSNRYRLVVLHVDTGQIEQELLLTDEKIHEARIEVISDQGLFLSLAGRELRRYGFRAKDSENGSNALY